MMCKCLIFIAGMLCLSSSELSGNSINVEPQKDKVFIVFYDGLAMTQYKLMGDTLLFCPNIPYKKMWLNYKILSTDEQQKVNELIQMMGSNLKDSQGYEEEVHCGSESIEIIKSNHSGMKMEAYYFKNNHTIGQFIDGFKKILHVKDSTKIAPANYLDKITFHSDQDTLFIDDTSWLKSRYSNFTLWSSMMFKDSITVLKKLDFDVNGPEVKKYEVSYLMDSEINKKKYKINAMYLYKNDVYIVFRSGVIHQFKGIYID